MAKLSKARQRAGQAYIRAKRYKRKKKPTRKRKPRTYRNQILGLPWWVVGGAALGLFLLTRKASAKTAPSGQPGTNMAIMPQGGWSYPPMTASTFASWCQANSGVQLNPKTCAISDKGVYVLSNNRIKGPGDVWVFDDPDLF